VCQYFRRNGRNLIVTGFCFFKILFIYLFDTQRERVPAGGTAEGGGEADSLPSREPNAGLNPRTLGL